MNRTKKLPIGIEDFEKIRTEEFYYIDKTGMIRDLLNSWGEVNLFTRPRRFGKSLNMNMLKYFFEYGCDKRLFDGLEIAQEKEMCEKYMGQFPVISITLKGVGGGSYETSRAMLCSVIGREAMRFSFLAESNRLSGAEKIRYAQLTNADAGSGQSFRMSDDILKNSLLTLSELLWKHYGQKVILLIDEYDVPLDKAGQFNYYDEMLELMRSLLGQALKSNSCLYFAVLTGCLRIAKESIFTGLNNFKVLSITDVRFDGCFGFSDREVMEMLRYYGFEDRYEKIKEWYDGYRFGKVDLYCPWDVINYVDLLCSEPDALPKAFWINTSGNDVIRNFLRMSKQRTRREIEKLIDGGSVVKGVNQELTYRDLYSSVDHLWSILFMTGYLTGRRADEDETYHLTIPNLEIRMIFVKQIMEWFQEEARKDTPRLDAFCDAFLNADSATIEDLFNAYLKKTISIQDTSVRKAKKENFYHGILLGLLSHREEWDIDSNAESGDGYSDIQIEIEEKQIGIVVEVKYSESGNLKAGCEEALQQIEDKEYASRLLQDGMSTIIKYGIACNKKKCMVLLGRD